MRKLHKDKSDGCIFMIPLFLPDWTIREQDDLIDYGAYPWDQNDVYAFARLIETAPANYDVVEIFRHAGPVPDDPAVIAGSGRLFHPVCVVMHHSKKRWRIVFADPAYDRMRDSAYDEVGFLLLTQLCLGGKCREIGLAEANRLRAAGAWPDMLIHCPTQLENRIRMALAKQGFDYDYQTDALRHLDGLPKPRERDAAFRKKIAPFRLSDLGGAWSITLEAGEYRQDAMERKGWLGNGHDWAAVARSFARERMPRLADKLTFDPEAGMFSVRCRNKPDLKKFGQAFKAACEDGSAFEPGGESTPGSTGS
jgi:hypothetical protein